MRARRVAALVLGCLVSLVATGCKNPDFCCSTKEACDDAKRAGFGDGTIVPCPEGDPDHAFCDDFGVYKHQNECIKQPEESRCEGNDQCMAPTPFCVDRTCRECQDDSNCKVAAAPNCTQEHACGPCEAEADCAGHAGTPHCGSSGACVACRTSADCAASEPVCNAASMCEKCTSGEQCGSLVCEASGACRASDRTIYVAPNGSDASTTCSQLEPCRTINRVLEQKLITLMRNVIHVAPGEYSSTGALVIGMGTGTFTIVGEGASLTVANPGPVVQISGPNTDVTIEGLRIYGAMTAATGDGVQCGNGATVTLRHAKVEGNQGRGVLSTACTLTLDRTEVRDNHGGGIEATGGQVTARNSVFIGNGTATGPDATLTSGASVQRPTAVSLFEFCTFKDNHAATGNAEGVACAKTVAAIQIQNSIVVGATTLQVDSRCETRYVLSNQDLTFDKTLHNIQGSPTFQADGYHLMDGSEGIDDADPAATLDHDIDGDLRPLPADKGRDIGADEVRR